MYVYFCSSLFILFISVYVCFFLFISVYFCLFLFSHRHSHCCIFQHKWLLPQRVQLVFVIITIRKLAWIFFFQQGLCYDESGPARGATVRKGIKGEALISAGARHGAKVRGREAPARARRARRQQGPPEERAQGSGRIKRARRAQKKKKNNKKPVTP